MSTSPSQIAETRLAYLDMLIDQLRVWLPEGGSSATLEEARDVALYWLARAREDEHVRYRQVQAADPA